jgi:hypothetical protein
VEISGHPTLGQMLQDWFNKVLQIPTLRPLVNLHVWLLQIVTALTSTLKMEHAGLALQ